MAPSSSSSTAFLAPTFAPRLASSLFPIRAHASPFLPRLARPLPPPRHAPRRGRAAVTAKVDASSAAKEVAKGDEAGAGSADSSTSAMATRKENYSQWYLDVIAGGDLCESSPVKGCMIIRPNGMALWEIMREGLDKRIKRLGAKNVYFPLFIPQSFLSKEAEHVDGFAKECAVVTHHRLRAKPGEPGVLEPDPDAKLEDPLVVRPTSETVIWNTFGRWIQSYRDLPMLVNQWANVVRWEMRTRPFLRTSEFFWQEGHTAHATAEEALALSKKALDLYATFCEEHLSLPVVKGVKSPTERFAGAEETFTIEARMQNGWALQSGTSHFLGQNFARAFDVRYQKDNGDRELVWATSWGVSTRLIGALIMSHSDDTGLVLPPKVAPIQVVIVTIWRRNSEREAVEAYAAELQKRLLKIDVRVEVDNRDNMRPGAKYFEWERKGVPLRIEVGPRDVKQGRVVCARRVFESAGGEETARNDAKIGIDVNDAFEGAVESELGTIQNLLLTRAKERLESNICRGIAYEEMKNEVVESKGEGKFYLVPWKCDAVNEKQIKEDCKATIRCYPFEFQSECEGAKCFFSGEPATHMAIFARSY